MRSGKMDQLHKKALTTAKRVLCVCLAASLLSCIVPAGAGYEVAAKRDPMFKLSAAKTVAVSKSDNLESLEIQVSSKQAAMQSAVKSLKEKERNMATTRWSPLLNIKFPTKPNEEEAFTFQFKPKQLQYQINILKHKMGDEKLKIYESVSNIYIEIITAQQAIKYDNTRLTALTTAVEKLEAKRVEGSVTQEKVDKAKTALENLQEQLANDKSKFERAKQKLSDKVGFDVTTGYRFEEAFVTADLSRDYIPLLQSKALEKDQGVYEAEIAEEEALLALRVNYSLMSNQYGGYMSIINTYVDQALGGEKINKKAFKSAYDEFTKRIDEKWQGHYKFLFIKIPKEWLKGDLDGIRYIEDDPYVLHTAALDYESARKECANTKQELRNAVSEGYDNYAETRKSYVKLNKQTNSAVKKLAVSEAKNLLGELSDDEYETEKKEVESMQSELNEALSTYSKTLFSFDRTCCGAVSQYLRGGGAGEKEERLNSIIQTGVTYTIRPIVSSEEFLLSLNVPDDFEAKSGLHITDFALYSDGRQIGSRVKVGEAIRHLALSVEDVGTVTVRIYDGGTFLDECEIDPTVYIGDLKITTGYDEGGSPHAIGKYTVSDNLSTDMITLTFTFDQDKIKGEYTSGKEAKYYNISTETGAFLRSEDKIPAEETFSYLSFIKGDIGNLTLHIYDEDKETIGEAIFSEAKKELIHDITEDEAEEIAQQKEEQAKQDAIDEEKLKAEQAAAEKRKKAEDVLKRLGFAVTDANMEYALAHVRELGYAADLIDSNQQMSKSYEKDQQTYKDGQANGMSQEELDKLQKRMTSYVEMQKKQQETIDNLKVLNDLKKMNGQR